jgi:hypothetical protein
MKFTQYHTASPVAVDTGASLSRLLKVITYDITFPVLSPLPWLSRLIDMLMYHTPSLSLISLPVVNLLNQFCKATIGDVLCYAIFSISLDKRGIVLTTIGDVLWYTILIISLDKRDSVSQYITDCCWHYSPLVKTDREDSVSQYITDCCWHYSPLVKTDREDSV